MRFLDEVVEHPLGHFEIGNHAVFHRPDGDDIPRRAAQHFLGFPTHCFDFAVGLVDRHNGRFVDDDAFSLSENKSIGGSEIYGQIGRKKTK